MQIISFTNQSLGLLVLGDQSAKRLFNGLTSPPIQISTWPDLCQTGMTEALLVLKSRFFAALVAPAQLNLQNSDQTDKLGNLNKYESRLFRLFLTLKISQKHILVYCLA